LRFSTTSPLSQAPGLAQILAAGIEECRQRDDDVCGNQQSALEVITPSIDHQVVDDKRAGKQADRLKETEIQTHIPIETPAQQDDERGDEDGDLDAAAQRDADGQIHLVLGRDGDGGDVFGRVSDDGQDDEADEGLADARLLYEVVDAVDEELGADGHERGDDQEEEDGRGAREGFLAVRVFDVNDLDLLVARHEMGEGLR
jgi:hypothetical protein